MREVHRTAPPRSGVHLHRSAFLGAAWLALVALPACTTRPVSTAAPTLKTNFQTEIRSAAVNKIDLLFMIDNSPSMGDKQDYLRQAIPDLLARFVTPSCVDPTGRVVGVSHDDGVCDAGKVEFSPVHDLHIGIVSSALGPRGGDLCLPADANDSSHQDDHAHLLNRAGADEHAIPAMQPDNFLAWFPAVPENVNAAPSPGAEPIGDVPTYEGDFQDLVAGVHQGGCGIESQLESWYRFLVQPDPYDHIATDANGPSWVGVDQTLLQERHDFLRPDSLVAIVTLSDENDSEIDVRSLGGQGVLFMQGSWTPPRGSSVCDQSPGDPACAPCPSLSPEARMLDPNCADGGVWSSWGDWGMNANLRHVHMKQKYGVDPQYPIDRYVTGLSAPRVPDRNGTSCQNPLFAASLPSGQTSDAGALCNLPAGTRNADLVFYAHIGGVPHELLHFDPNDPSSTRLTSDDWQKILGKDPLHFDTTGIDPHMIESVDPRPGLPPPSSADDADPISGREWVTTRPSDVDIQYACTFPLAAPRACPFSDPGLCDCSSTTLPHDQLPPVCDANSPAMQVRAKAYPTIRELLLAKLLGTQGVVSSICPIDVVEETPGDPLYGYRPAVAAIVDRLKNALTTQCVPHPLRQDPATGQVPCLVLETLVGVSGGEEVCARNPGMSAPDAAVLQHLRDQQRLAHAAGGPDLTGFPVCQLAQLTGSQLVNGSCVSSTGAGWCYVENDPHSLCDSEILFSPAANPTTGADVSLQCIESTAGP